MSRTIQISLSEDLLHILDVRAQRSGLRCEDYAAAIVSRDLEHASTLSEALEPFRQAVAASGLTDSELASLFEEARTEECA